MYSLLKAKKRFFNWATKSIFDTPPIKCDPSSSLVVLSQSYHADVTMYLIAAKSFARYVRPQAFVIVDDGLTDDDRAVLCDHLDRVQFLRTQDVDVGTCPRRGCWERLISISRLCADHYIVQLDSDTVTRDCPDEVLDCVRNNHSFTLGTLQGQRIVSGVEAAAFAESIQDTVHVQILAERALGRFPNARDIRYVRGCAGFAGFARGSFSFEKLQSFSDRMQALLGEDCWGRWGSEQVTSNFIVANTPGAGVLAIDRYMNWVPSRDAANARLLHFIGDYRFKGLQYIRQSRRAIASAGYVRSS